VRECIFCPPHTGLSLSLSLSLSLHAARDACGGRVHERGEPQEKQARRFAICTFYCRSHVVAVWGIEDVLTSPLSF